MMRNSTTEGTEKTACRNMVQPTRLTARANHFPLNFVVFSSVFSVPLWFNCGF